VSEIMAVAEHTAGLCAAAEGLRLPVDLPDPIEPSDPYAVRPADLSDLDGEAATAIAEIEAWARGELGVGRVPLIWSTLAHLPRLMVSTWRKDRLVMSAGRLDERAKACIAFCGGQPQTEPVPGRLYDGPAQAFTRSGRQGDGRAGRLGLHYVSFNTISHGMLLEPASTEMKASDFVDS
jgi:hypothetical protein